MKELPAPIIPPWFEHPERRDATPLPEIPPPPLEPFAYPVPMIPEADYSKAVVKALTNIDPVEDLRARVEALEKAIQDIGKNQA